MARACVVGASGFAGALTAALLWAPSARSLEAVTARTDAGRRLDDLYPRYRVPLELEQFDAERLGAAADVAMVVVSAWRARLPLVAELRAQGLRVVDLSADFRLHDAPRTSAGTGSTARPSCATRRCSASPSCTATRSPRASLVANPGCYSTAAILALAPLAREGLIADAVVDAKSGVSGAGREANERTHFVSVGRERERHTRSTATGTRPRSTRSWARSASSGA